MRNKRRTDEEWLSLIQQCRSSGFSDRAWCEQNDFSKIVSCHGNAYVNFCVIRRPFQVLCKR